ncbi:MAG: transcriptional repressor [Firmicutes bacterium]|nr:transcriptional repressor [Bacillota bacterium]
MTKIRNTKQRQLILDLLKGTTAHPSADWLYQRVRETMPNVSLGTVYRNLGILKQQGIIQELRHAGSQCRYDGNPEPHYHFFCDQCDQVEDIEGPNCMDLLANIQSCMPSHTIEGHRLEVYGCCPSCTRKNLEEED